MTAITIRSNENIRISFDEIGANNLKKGMITKEEKQAIDKFNEYLYKELLKDHTKEEIDKLFKEL
ncbi:MAG: hypothetical protein BWY78_00071 [Alphaproteobacteria bacterium ADurb.Bin438]|nr:MAG: hypothetical protein BWY78_00071 [Alphaproteobacteria bacterium ADurb.Bin438]